MKKRRHPMGPCFVFVVGLLAGSAPRAGGGEILYPADAGVVNVKLPPYSAVGNGIADDTAAIQQALSDHTGKQFSIRTLYFPNGTYRVSDGLRWVDATGGGKRYFIMQGQSREGAVIRLDDQTPGFGDPAAPKPLLDCQPNSANNNVAFLGYIENLTFDIGAGNPGAVGVDYIASNAGAIRDVTVRSSDPAGAGLHGFAFVKSWPGPFLVKNVEVQGFDQGIRVLQSQYGITFEHVVLRDQRVAGIHNDRNMLAIRGLRSENRHAVPAVVLDNDRGGMALIDALFRYTGAGVAQTAAVNNRKGAALYLRDTSASGYASTLQSESGEVSTNLVGTVGEFASHTVRALFESPAVGLRLPVRETPTYTNNSFSDWARVSNAGDATASMQAAMDSGKPVVYLPANPEAKLNWYKINDTITIPPTVRRVRALGQPLRLGSGFHATDKPILRVMGDSTEPLILEHFAHRTADNGVDVGAVPFVEHASSRPLVLVSIVSCGYRSTPISGDLYIEDVTGARAPPNGWLLRRGQRVWARQWNPEDLQNGPWPLIRNSGADVWILGLKTEGAKTVLHTETGGRTELLGGFFYPVHAVPAELPLMVNHEGSVSLAAYLTQGKYEIQMRETRANVTRTLEADKLPSRGGATVKMPLYTGYRPPLEVSNVQAASGKAYIVDDSLETGDLLYIDRGFTFGGVLGLAGMPYIRTANDDKNAAQNPFLTFTVNRNVLAHLLYDDRANGLPPGFVGWADTGIVLSTSDTARRVWTRGFPVGNVALPGNLGGGTTGARSMYGLALAITDATPPSQMFLLVR